MLITYLCRQFVSNVYRLTIALSGCLILLAPPSFGQFLEAIQQPPGIKWQQIATPHYDLIFPADIVNDAQRVANTLEYLYEPLRKTQPAQRRRWSLLLTNHSTIGNGYVTLAPRKSEWFATPPTNAFTGSNEWYNLLAVHEGRHMVQFDAMNRGFTYFAGLLFGEIGQLLLDFNLVPAWYWEGDAVAMETALTSSGRGRLPEFDVDIRTQLLSGKRFSYYKAYLGSYRDYCGDYYQLGYLLVSEARRRYGSSIWNQVLERGSRRSYSPFAFSKMLRKTIGCTTPQFYQTTMAALAACWREQLERIEITSSHCLTKEPKVWTNYTFPHWQPDGSLIALRYGLADIPTLVRVQADGKEEVLTAIPTTERISVGGGKVVWSEYNANPRWQAAIFSDVVVLDLETKKARTITSGGRYLVPTVAPDGNSIAAVKFTPERQCHLVLLDPQTGAEQMVLPNPENAFIKYPSWSPDGKRMVFVRQVNNELALSIYDFEHGEMRDIISAGNENISWPIFYGDYLLYSSPCSGIDNIYAVSLMTGKRYQVTARPFGAYYPAVASLEEQLAFSDYTVKGLSLNIQELTPNNWRPIENVLANEVRLYEPLVAQEQGAPLNWQNIPQKTYPVVPYDSRKHLVNIHSWLILPSPPLFMGGLMSHDLLSTASFMSMIIFNSNERTFNLNGLATYAGFYPIFDVSAQIGNRHETDDTGKSDYWQEKSLTIGARLPLDFSTGIYQRSLNLAFSTTYRQVAGKTFAPQDNGALLPISFSLQYACYQMRAQRDIQPRIGYDLQINFQHTLFALDFRGKQLALAGHLLLPSFWRHHGVNIELATEQQQPGNYYFASPLAFPRGYDFVTSDQFYKGSLSYALPLFYPDWALGSLFYLKRIRQNLFGDYGLIKRNDIYRHYRSAGSEILFDFYLFTLPIELSAGVRWTYRFETRSPRWEVVLGGVRW